MCRATGAWNYALRTQRSHAGLTSGAPPALGVGNSSWSETLEIKKRDAWSTSRNQRFCLHHTPVRSGSFSYYFLLRNANGGITQVLQRDELPRDSFESGSNNGKSRTTNQ